MQLAIPIYHGGLTTSRVREALANEEKARQDLENEARRIALLLQLAQCLLSAFAVVQQPVPVCIQPAEAGTGEGNKDAVGTLDIGHFAGEPVGLWNGLAVLGGLKLEVPVEKRGLRLDAVHRAGRVAALGHRAEARGALQGCQNAVALCGGVVTRVVDPAQRTHGRQEMLHRIELQLEIGAVDDAQKVTVLNAVEAQLFPGDDGELVHQGALGHIGGSEIV